MQVIEDGKLRRTEKEWRGVLAQWGKSGLSPQEFCKTQSLPLSTFLRWRQKLSKASIKEAFVQVTPPEPPTSSWKLTITLPNGSKLRFQG